MASHRGDDCAQDPIGSAFLKGSAEKARSAAGYVPDDSHIVEAQQSRSASEARANVDATCTWSRTEETEGGQSSTEVLGGENLAPIPAEPNRREENKKTTDEPRALCLQVSQKVLETVENTMSACEGLTFRCPSVCELKLLEDEGQDGRCRSGREAGTWQWDMTLSSTDATQDATITMSGKESSLLYISAEILHHIDGISARKPTHIDSYSRLKACDGALQIRSRSLAVPRRRSNTNPEKMALSSSRSRWISEQLQLHNSWVAEQRRRLYIARAGNVQKYI
jgi:hypothetical protein